MCRRDRPPTEAVKLLDDFLTEVSKRGLHTYLIAGNHDSAQRLEFGKEIFGRESIHKMCIRDREHAAETEETSEEPAQEDARPAARRFADLDYDYESEIKIPDFLTRKKF